MKPFYVFLFFCLGLIPITLYAQDGGQRTQGRSVEQYPFPYARMHYLQPRFDRTYNDNGTYTNSYILRAFSTFWSNWHFRAEIPLSDSNVSGRKVFGLADINLRAVHSHRLHKKLFIAYGGELVLNTATDNSLGAGKWDIRPGAGIIYFRGTPEEVTGTQSVSMEYRVTMAKEAGVSRTNMLALSPNIDWWFPRWYIGYYATWTYDIDNNIFDIPIDVEAGYTVIPNFTLGFEFIYPLVSKVSYRNEFAVKLRYNF